MKDSEDKKYKSRALRTRLRYGLIISLEEYCVRRLDEVRNFQAEAMASGFIGWVDIWGNSARLFVYESKNEALKAKAIAQQIGFASAGTVEGEIYINNTALHRPHLKTRSNFYKEYYK